MANLSDLISATSAQELLVQTLKDAGFEGDLTPGSPVYQLLIDPNAAIYASNVAKQDEMKNAWSLLSGSSNPNIAISTEMMENLFNNLRILPSAGAKASGKLTLVFSTNTTRNISSSSFIAPDGSVFVPALPYTLVPSDASRSSYSASELVYVSDPSGYSVTIDVEAIEIGETSVGSGDLFTTTISGLTQAYAATSFSGGKIVETVDDLIKDVPDILSETSGVSPISVTASIRSEFPDLNEIRIFRAGDDEMRRAGKNPFGIDVGAADIVVTTSKKPSVTRRLIPGHIELSIDEDGVFYNGQHRLGYAYRPSDEEDSIQADEILNSFVYVEGSTYDRTMVGAISVLDAGIETSSTRKTTTVSADQRPADFISVLRRSLVQDNRYGNLPVLGDDPKDFHFSAYQDRIKFEFRTKWSQVEDVVDGVYNRTYAWLKFWSVYYRNGGSMTGVESELASIANSFDPSLPSDQIPTTFRPEVPIYADISYYEGLADIQEYINDNNRRCFGQDYVVKSPFINSVSLEITVSRDADFVRFREGGFKTKIANYITSTGLSRTSSITTEHIKSLIFEEASSDVNDKFEMYVSSFVQKSDNTYATESRDFIDYIEDYENGITPRNSIFMCSENNINISYE